MRFFRYLRELLEFSLSLDVIISVGIIFTLENIIHILLEVYLFDVLSPLYSWILVLVLFVLASFTFASQQEEFEEIVEEELENGD